jgi:hypothetical protein
MFRQFKKVGSNEDISVFAVTIGAANKRTLAEWHLNEPTDLISTLDAILLADSDKSNGIKTHL